MFSNRLFDILKYIAQIALPALGALIFGLGQVWHFPAFAEQLVGTITLVDAFLGILLGISTYKYNKNVQ